VVAERAAAVADDQPVAEPVAIGFRDLGGEARDQRQVRRLAA
jgi:hypothetical protein